MQEAWIKEYARKGIPSSFRTDPTKPLIACIEWLKEHNLLKPGHAADIGCGLGRNSFYLASQGFAVTGMDLLERNVDWVNKEAQLSDVPVKAYAVDVSTPWPISSHSLDLVIDIFCYKHILSKDKQVMYRRELFRTLKEEGYYFLSLASQKDGFYGPLLENSDHVQEKAVIDPVSGIPSFLYSPEGIEEEFTDYFELVQLKEQTSSSPMYGQEYARHVINAIFRKRDTLNGKPH